MDPMQQKLDIVISILKNNMEVKSMVANCPHCYARKDSTIDNVSLNFTFSQKDNRKRFFNTARLTKCPTCYEKYYCVW
ncbi:hypothetical protein ABSA28_01198 [Candidatus Hepatincolaceae symbiont of Richtersius coronifer]